MQPQTAHVAGRRRLNSSNEDYPLTNNFNSLRSARQLSLGKLETPRETWETLENNVTRMAAGQGLS